MTASVLIALATLMASFSAAVLAFAIYQGGLRPLAQKLRECVPEKLAAGKRLLSYGAALNRPFLFGSYEQRLRHWLLQAGEPAGLSAGELLTFQELGALLGLAIGAIIAVGLRSGLFWVLPAALLGGFYPLLWLRGQIKKRREQIVRALPFNLDLLTLSVEAGLDFGGALAKVVEKGKGGPLREELQLVLKRLKVGKTREEALKAMTARVEVVSLSKFVTAVILADRMGASLGKVLRSQATQLRIERTQRAEKLASQAPVKMLFPLVTCIFPTVFMVLFGPILFALLFGSQW